MNLLERGASAEEAAVTAAAVLSVVLPHLTGLGGDAYFLTFEDGNIRVLNAAGYSGAIIPEGLASLPERGSGSIVTVPGAVSGWQALLNGMPMSIDILGPAISLAESSPIDPALERWMRSDNGMLWRDVMARREGDRFSQPELAGTLRQMAEGADLYCSRICVELCRTLAEWEVPLADFDFHHQHAEWTEPVRGEFFGHDVWVGPAESRGYLTLNLLSVAGSDWASEDSRQRMIEAFREVPMATPAAAGGDTVAFSVVDENGRAVAGMQSLRDKWGSGMWCPRTGILFHNSGRGFSLRAQDANYLTPRSRPLHALCPVIATKEGALSLLAGTMGGLAQPQILAQVLTRLLAAGETAHDAVAAPRWIWGDDGGQPDGLLTIESDSNDHDQFGHCNLIDLRGPQPVAVSDWRAR